MQPEFVYFFLSGNDQNGAPVIVVFAISTRYDVAYVMPYAMIHPTSMPNHEVPLIPTKLGRIVPNNTIRCPKGDARILWEMLCDDTQYNMKPTTFDKHYPNKTFDQVRDRPNFNGFYQVRNEIIEVPTATGKIFYKSGRVYGDYNGTNYALEA